MSKILGFWMQHEPICDQDLGEKGLARVGRRLRWRESWISATLHLRPRLTLRKRTRKSPAPLNEHWGIIRSSCGRTEGVCMADWGGRRRGCSGEMAIGGTSSPWPCDLGERD